MSSHKSKKKDSKEKSTNIFSATSAEREAGEQNIVPSNRSKPESPGDEFKYYVPFGVMGEAPYNFTPCPFPTEELPPPGPEFEKKVLVLAKKFFKTFDFQTKSKEPSKDLFSLANEISYGIKKPIRVPNSAEKHSVRALFYSQTTRKPEFISLEIKKSGIEGAGVGVFAMNDIPRGCFVIWQGVYTNSLYADKEYSWSVMEYDEKTGIALSEGDVVYDINPLSVNGWYGFVNCGEEEESNNVSSVQSFDKIIVYTSKDVFAGEELFIDYGEDYRHKMGIYYDGEDSGIITDED